MLPNFSIFNIFILFLVQIEDIFIKFSNFLDHMFQTKGVTSIMPAVKTLWQKGAADDNAFVL